MARLENEHCHFSYTNIRGDWRGDEGIIARNLPVSGRTFFEDGFSGVEIRSRI